MIPFKFWYRWTYGKEDGPSQQTFTSRVVVQGFHEADTRADKAAPLASSSESAHLFIALPAKHVWPLKVVDIILTFLHVRFEPDGLGAFVKPRTARVLSLYLPKLITSEN